MHTEVLGKGKDLVFLHGWGGSTDSFLGVARRLCDNYRCILIDLYGFGKTPLEGVMSLEDYADGVEETLRHLQITDAVIIGHSFGGRIATVLAARNPNYLRAIVLTDAAGLRPRKTWTHRWRRLKYRMRKALGLSTAQCGSPDYRVLQGDMRKTFVQVVNTYLDDRLSDIRVPVLVVWGKQDKETPPYMARRLCKKIAQAGCVWLNGGHYAYIEEINTFVAVIRSFAGDVYAERMDSHADFGGGNSDVDGVASDMECGAVTGVPIATCREDSDRDPTATAVGNSVCG